jgi:DDE superfamily endonuclease
MEQDRAKEALLHVVRRDPRQYGVQQSRWRLTDLLEQSRWLTLKTESGMSQLLQRLGIHYKRGRDYVHSPDPFYQAKVDEIKALKERMQTKQGQEVLLYLDELTYYRQPSLARAYEEAGAARPQAQRSLLSNTATRVVGTLEAFTGRVLFQSGSKVGIKELVRFYQTVHQAYPLAQRLWVVQDNWPIHFHPDVLVALEPQTTPFAFPRPKDWPDKPSDAAAKRWGDLHLPIQFVLLPTYASWCNPIEKLWRKLKQEVLHLHRFAHDLKALRTLVTEFLQQFAAGSSDLLRYVGLHIPS